MTATAPAGTEPGARVPRVSVCVPTYNYGRFLGEAIESVLAQTMPDWELVVSDNASTDETADVVRRYADARIRYFRADVTVPMLENFNRSLGWARGEHVLFLCADDALTPAQLELLADALDAHPTAGLAVARRQINVDDAGRSTGPVKVHPLGPGLVPGAAVLAEQCRRWVTVGLPPQVLARRTIVVAEGGFDPRASQGADNELFSRICDRWDAVYVDEAAFRYRWHPAMTTYASRRSLDDIRSDHYVFSRLFRESPALRDNRALRTTYVKQRLYPWFERALVKLAQGDVRSAVWIVRRIADFARVPWWVPYFLYRFTRNQAATLVHRYRDA